MGRRRGAVTAAGGESGGSRRLRWLARLRRTGGACAERAAAAWQLGMQPAASPVREHIDALHNELLVIITLITLFVLGLLLYVIVRFNAKRHPVPSQGHAQHRCSRCSGRWCRC